ncbi:MAG TPA: AI-2E family transporter [Oligoflexia bacterium]|nr:AI-2E family transporter [Oligoflexia bacterium]HMR23819.1 AI-2E family transporter [Oligoflexia bacterium]
MTKTDKLSQSCLLILTAIALAFSLAYVKNIAVPFVISVFMYAVFLPITSFLQRKAKLSRDLSILVTMLGFLIFASMLVVFIVQSLQAFAQNAGQYQNKVIESLNFLQSIAKKWNIRLNIDSLESMLQNIPVFDLITNVSGELLNILGNAGLIIIFVLFLFFGTQKNTVRSKTIDLMQEQVSQYSIAKFFISLGTAVSQGILLSVLNVEMVLMFSVLTFLLNFIPNIGSIIAVLLPLPLAILQFGFTFPFYVLLFLSIAIQMIWGNILEPKLLGQTLGFHPVTILLCLLFWGLVWGIPGMFLAVPMTSILKIILEQIDATKSIAKLLEGQLNYQDDLS